MREMVVDFNDVQKTLEPMFGGGFVRIAVENHGVLISAEKPQKKQKARGIAKEYADPSLIPLEKVAWERAAVEKYTERFGGTGDDS